MCVFHFLKIIIKKYIKAISVFLKILFYSLPVASEIYIYIHQSLQGNGRKETVFGWRPKATHTGLNVLHWGQSTAISHTDTHLLNHSGFHLFSHLHPASSGPIWRSNIICTNFSSCFKMSPHLYNTLQRGSVKAQNRHRGSSWLHFSHLPTQLRKRK